MKPPLWVCSLCLAMLAAGPLAAADGWLVLRSQHFEMYTQTREGTAREILEDFERLHRFLEQTFGDMTPRQPVRIVAFSSDKEFEQYRPNEVTPSFYSGAQGGDTIALGPFSQRIPRLALRQYVRVVTRDSSAGLPFWFGEGLADMVGFTLPSDRLAVVGRPPGRLTDALQELEWLPLSTVFATREDSALLAEKNGAAIFYAESWAMVHMLALDRKYRPRLELFVRALQEGQPEEAALKAVYGKSVVQAQQDLRSHAAWFFSSGTVWFLFEPDHSVEKADVAAANLLDVNLVLAGLLEERAPAEARSRYEALAKERPDRPEPEEALAFLDLRKDSHGAVEHFERAMNLGSRNPAVYWSYARALDKDDSAAARVFTAIKKVIELDPSNVDAKLAAADRLARAGRSQEVLALLSGVDKLTAEQALRLFETLAFVKFRLGDLKDARAAAERLLKYAQTDEQKARAEELLAEIGKREKMPEQ